MSFESETSPEGMNDHKKKGASGGQQMAVRFLVQDHPPESTNKPSFNQKTGRKRQASEKKRTVLCFTHSFSANTQHQLAQQHFGMSTN